MLLARCVMAVTILWSLAAPELVGAKDSRLKLPRVPAKVRKAVAAYVKAVSPAEETRFLKAALKAIKGDLALATAAARSLRPLANAQAGTHHGLTFESGGSTRSICRKATAREETLSGTGSPGPRFGRGRSGNQLLEREERRGRLYPLSTGDSQTPREPEPVPERPVFRARPGDRRGHARRPQASPSPLRRRPRPTEHDGIVAGRILYVVLDRVLARRIRGNRARVKRWPCGASGYRPTGSEPRGHANPDSPHTGRPDHALR